MGVEHAGTTPRLQLDPFWDAASQEADPTSCMGCEACRESSWVKVCPNAPQVRRAKAGMACSTMTHTIASYTATAAGRTDLW